MNPESDLFTPKETAVKVDKRKQSSQANIQKALEARRKKMEEQKRMKEQYADVLNNISSSSDDDDDDDEEDMIVYKPSVVKKEPKQPKQSKQPVQEDDLRKQFEEMRQMMMMMTMNKIPKQRKTKKIIVEREVKAPPQPIQAPVQTPAPVQNVETKHQSTHDRLYEMALRNLLNNH